MPTIVELPGQVEVEFPDGMPPERIAQVILPFQLNREYSYGHQTGASGARDGWSGVSEGYARQLYKQPGDIVRFGDILQKINPARGFVDQDKASEAFTTAADWIDKKIGTGYVEQEFKDIENRAGGPSIQRDLAQALGMVTGPEDVLIPGAITAAPFVAKALGKFGDEAIQAAVKSPLNTELGAITYHGSPHKFDKFKHSQMGTGEGAQAYGWGTYLADNPSVAKSYQPDRSYVGRFMQTGDAGQEWTPDWIAQTAIDEYGDDAADHLRKVLRQRKGLKSAGQAAENAKVEDAIGKIERGEVASRGNLYEVDLPDEQIAKMLDWDAPLSEQSKEAQEMAAHAFARETGITPDHENYNAMVDLVREQLDAKTGKQFYEAMIQDNLRAAKGDRVIAQQFASEKLNQLGIPGIKYWDGGSRQAGSGTRNYVVFDEDLMTILKRNDEALNKSGFDRTTTDMPYYDDLINKPELKDYFRENKGIEYRMVDITPDEYISTVDEGFKAKHSSGSGAMAGIDNAKVKRYAEKMKKGEKFPALTLDYARGKALSQEGRHRALAAKEAGIDRLPVLIVTPTQEEAKYLGTTVPELNF